MNRITNAQLDYRLAQVNRLLGFGEAPAYSTVGAVTLYSAYGSTGVQRYCNEQGGVSTLMSLGTKREAYNFLAGMLAGLDNPTSF